jgi:hypothetical protein
MLVFQCCIDSGNFFQHINIGCVKLSDPAEILQCLCSLISAHQPSWGFLDEEETNEHQTGWNELDLGMISCDTLEGY